MSNEEAKISRLETKMDNIEKTTDRIEKKLDDYIDRADKYFVSKVEFDPVKSLVYGCVTIILASVLTAIIYLVVK